MKGLFKTVCKKKAIQIFSKRATPRSYIVSNSSTLWQALLLELICLSRVAGIAMQGKEPTLLMVMAPKDRTTN